MQKLLLLLEQAGLLLLLSHGHRIVLLGFHFYRLKE